MNSQLTVLHLANTYLPYSRTWIHRQIVGVPGARGTVVAQRVVEHGLEKFPVPALTVLARLAPVRFSLARLFGARALREVSPLALGSARATRPDIAHAHFGHVAWQYLPLVRRLELPLATSFYGHDATELARSWRGRYQEVFAQSALVFCEGPALAEAVVGLGCPPEKVRIQRLGIDASNLPFCERTLKNGDRLEVVIAARFKEKKGVPDAIAAVAKASQRIDVHLTIVGDARHDSAGLREKRRIRQAVSQFGMAERVTFAGRLDHAHLIRRARDFHVVLQPSRRASTGDTEGGLPVALIELAATGLPVVATRHADIPELVVDGHTGLLADEGDTETLAAHLVTLATQPALLSAVGRDGAARARQVFDHAACGLELKRHYLEACGRADAVASRTLFRKSTI